MMMHLYSALLCIVVHPKCFTIMQSSTWMMQRLPQDNDASALTAHQLQVEKRESHRANQVVFKGQYHSLSRPYIKGAVPDYLFKPHKSICLMSKHTNKYIIILIFELGNHSDSLYRIMIFIYLKLN